MNNKFQQIGPFDIFVLISASLVFLWMLITSFLFKRQLWKKTIVLYYNINVILLFLVCGMCLFFVGFFNLIPSHLNTYGLSCNVLLHTFHNFFLFLSVYVLIVWEFRYLNILWKLSSAASTEPFLHKRSVSFNNKKVVLCVKLFVFFVSIVVLFCIPLVDYHQIFAPTAVPFNIAGDSKQSVLSTLSATIESFCNVTASWKYLLMNLFFIFLLELFDMTHNLTMSYLSIFYQQFVLMKQIIYLYFLSWMINGLLIVFQLLHMQVFRGIYLVNIVLCFFFTFYRTILRDKKLLQAKSPEIMQRITFYDLYVLNIRMNIEYKEEFTLKDQCIFIDWCENYISHNRHSVKNDLLQSNVKISVDKLIYCITCIRNILLFLQNYEDFGTTDIDHYNYIMKEYFNEYNTETLLDFVHEDLKNIVINSMREFVSNEQTRVNMLTQLNTTLLNIIKRIFWTKYHTEIDTIFRNHISSLTRP